MTTVQLSYTRRLDSMGHPGYLTKAQNVRSDMEIVKAEAGPHWRECPKTCRILDAMMAEIDEIEAEARERYLDWASD